jgi:hypothetical protein
LSLGCFVSTHGHYLLRSKRTFFKTNKKDISDFFAHVKHGSHGSDVYKTPPNQRKLNASGPWIQLLQFMKVRFVIRWKKGHCFFNAKGEEKKLWQIGHGKK